MCDRSTILLCHKDLHNTDTDDVTLPMCELIFGRSDSDKLARALKTPSQRLVRSDDPWPTGGRCYVNVSIIQPFRPIRHEPYTRMGIYSDITVPPQHL
jgi:hypothetical protein